MRTRTRAHDHDQSDQSDQPVAHIVVFVVTPVDVHRPRVDKERAQHHQQHHHRVFSFVHHVSVENVHVVLAGQSVLVTWWEEGIRFSILSYLVTRVYRMGLTQVCASVTLPKYN